VGDVFHGAGRESFDAIKMLRQIRPGAYTPASGASYPNGRFGESLKQITQLIKADVGLEVALPTWAAGTRTSTRALPRDS
jgi:hypothetical protein